MKQSMLCTGYADWPRPMTKLVAGLTILAVTGITGPYLTLAQLPQVQETAQAPAAASPMSSVGKYTLGGGDNIRIDIFELPQLSGNYQIPAGGVIQLPLVGSMSVQGMSLEDAANALSEAYGRFLKRPLITVSLQSTRPLNIWIAGEVNRPGSYAIPLASGAGNTPSVQFPTLVQVISASGGVTLAADIRRVQLRRSTGLEPEQVITFDLWRFLKTGQLSQDITLRDGDSIFIPTATNVNLAEVRELASANFAPPEDKSRSVTVLGEVSRPGSYVVLGGETTNGTRTVGLPTVTRAIQLAGGIKPQADIRRIQIRRVTRSGAEQILNLDLWQLLQAGDIMQDTLVQDGDTIVVPIATDLNPAEASVLATTNFSPAAIQVNVVGEVGRPGVVQVPPNASLNQALLAAGGFVSGRAHRESVELIRLNPDGTVSQRAVGIDFTQGINEQSNPLVRNNDIIVVRRSAITRLADNVNNTLGPANNVVGTILIPTRIVELLKLLGVGGN